MTGTEKIIAFLILSIPVVAISWRSLFSFKNHGLYRFLSWECIIWLLVSNFLYWFKNPLSPAQMASWIFLIYSLYLVLIAVKWMKKLGNPDKQREGEVLYKFEKTTDLIETGIFKYIRHPMYSSLIFLTWGICLKQINSETIVIASISTVFLFLTAWMEERENLKYFGEQYRSYMKKTRRFIPYLF